MQVIGRRCLHYALTVILGFIFIVAYNLFPTLKEEAVSSPIRGALEHLKNEVKSFNVEYATKESKQPVIDALQEFHDEFSKLLTQLRTQI